MEFKASLDSFAKGITIGVIILFAGLGFKSLHSILNAAGDNLEIITHSGILLLLAGLILACYLLAPQAYEITSEFLIIKRPAGDKRIGLSSIVEIKSMADSGILGAIRVVGVGGVFGYFGKYYVPKTGMVTYYATRRQNEILIKLTNGKKILVTPDDTGIMQELNKSLVLN